MWTECNPGSFCSAGALNLAWGFIIQARQIDAEEEREKCTDCRRERKEKMGRQSQVLISPCLTLLLLHYLWFIRGVMAGQGKGQVWRFGRRRERGRAGDWFVIVVFCGFTVSACSPFNSGHRQSNTIRISARHVRYISSCVPWVFLYRKRKGKAAVMSCLKRWKKGERENATLGHLGALVAQRISLLFSLLCQEMWIWLLLALSVFPSTTGLDYITMHSLTHLLPCAPFPADG